MPPGYTRTMSTETTHSPPGDLSHRAASDETLILKQLLASSIDIVFVKDTEGHYLAGNAAHAELIGLPEDAIIGRHDTEIQPNPEHIPYITETDRAVVETGEPYQATGQPMDVGGETRYFDIVKMPMRNDADEIVGIIGVGRDITRLHEAETRLLHQNRYLETFNRLVIELARHPASTDNFSDLIERGLAMVGADWALLSTTETVVSSGPVDEIACRLTDAIRRSGKAHVADPSEAGRRVRRATGTDTDEAIAIALPIGVGEHAIGSVTFGVGHGALGAGHMQRAREVAGHLSLAFSQRRLLLEAEHRAGHDGLTGLVNRATFDALLDQAAAEAARYDHSFGVVYLDLDGFKPVNDRLGHAAGDRVLSAIAERLGARMRRSDTVARIGGDEFAIIVRHVADHDMLGSISTQLAALCGEPVDVGGEHICVGASVGVAAYPHDAATPTDLLAVADRRMYEHKRAARRGRALAAVSPT